MPKRTTAADTTPIRVVVLTMDSHLSGAVARRWRGRLHILPLEQGILLQQFLDFLVELQRGQLQQPDRLLQLRRQRQVLRESEL